jgi:hypothetical protein
MKESLTTGDEEYNENEHDHIDLQVMGDVSSYIPGDSVAETVVASSSRSNPRFIVRARQSLPITTLISSRRDSGSGQSLVSLVQ